jgi:phosphate-selective porin
MHSPNSYWRRGAGIGWALAVCAAWAVAGTARAQDGRPAAELPLPVTPGAGAAIVGESPTAPSDDSPQAKAVRAIVDEYLKKKDEEKKKADEEKKKADEEKKKAEWYEVGSVLTMSARWNIENGVRLETPNKDFAMHFGFRFQDDWVWWTQTDTLRAPNQLGDLQDGTFFRRIRPSWDGQAWEVVEWNCELALEQVRQSLITLDEVWVGVTKIPYIGTVRVGHQKVPQGFEGDMVSSSKAMQFLERAAYTDAFYENFAPGLWTGNSVLDQRVTWAGMVYRPELDLHDNNGADFGDGHYAYTGRLTGLPIWDCDGRHLLHLGLSGTWRRAEKADPGLGGATFVRFRARPEMRDAIGDFGTAPLPGDPTRMVDTGNFIANSTTVIGTEMLYILGPFSVQAE